MSGALAVSTPGALVTTPMDQVAVLRALNLDPNDAKTQALVLTCQRYGLDPLLKHAVLIQGTLYVTRDGLMHAAHMSGKLDGIEVEFLQETPTHFIARASVWRKDMTRPFVYQGRFPKNGKNPVGNQYGPEMAEKVAECRALRRAFSIALCSREELWENEDFTPPAPAPAPAPVETPRPAPRPVSPPAPARVPKGEPVAPPDWDPRGEFLALAKERGLNICNEHGQPSKTLIIELLRKIYGTTIIEELPTSRDTWDGALKALQVWQPAPAPVTAPEPLPTLPGEDELEDPFA